MISLPVLAVAAIVAAGLGYFSSIALRGYGHIVRRVLLAVFALVACVIVVSVLAASFNTGLLFPVLIVGFVTGFVLHQGKKFSGLGLVPDTFGSSRWATKTDLRQNDVYGTDGIRIGKALNDTDEMDWVSYKSDRHLLTVAPTRSGKGTTQIIPNLLTYDGSMLVIDPKGENAMITAKSRANMEQEVHVVDPWNIAQIDGIQASAFNPLDWLDIRDPDIIENAMLLADALVIEGANDKAFFVEEAKALLQGLIMYVATSEAEDGRRTLKRVREHLVSSSDEQTKLFQSMANSDHHIISSTGHRCLQKDPELLSNVLASTQSHTHFLDSARIQKNTSVSDFKFEDLKSKPMTIYLVLPADRLNAFGRWMRLLIQQAITVNARNIETKPTKPVLFILDEFAALGRLSMAEQAFGLMAGFGMQLWAIVQDLNQLERIYGKGWQSFVANSGMINYFGSSDTMTSGYFSSMCGETTVWNFSSAISTALGISSGGNGGSSSETTTSSDTRAASQRKLIYPDELMRMNKKDQLVFIENMHPVLAFKQPWFDDPELKSLGVDLHAKD